MPDNRYDRTRLCRPFAVFAGGMLALIVLALAGSAYAIDQPVGAANETIFARRAPRTAFGRSDRGIPVARSRKGTRSAGRFSARPLVPARPVNGLRWSIEHAETISVMLLAFPHLFPAPTNQWKPNVERNPGTDTYAAPAIWENFADFYQKAGAASKVAYKAARVKQQDEFRSSVAALRNACDSCHAIYQKNE